MATATPANTDMLGITAGAFDEMSSIRGQGSTATIDNDAPRIFDESAKFIERTTRT